MRLLQLPEHAGDRADHEDLLARAGQVRALISADCRADALAAFDELIAALRRHTAIEEAGLFAGLRAAGEMTDHVEALSDDHAVVWGIVDRLDSLDPPRWDAAVIQLLDDLQDHISREECDLFPAALLAIGPADWSSVETAASEARAHAA